MTDRARITVTLTADLELTVGDVWPEDDGPDHPTALDVARIIAESRSPEQWITDWCIAPDIEVSVAVTTPNPHHDPTNAALLPDYAPDPTIRTAARVAYGDWGKGKRLEARP